MAARWKTVLVWMALSACSKSETPPPAQQAEAAPAPKAAAPGIAATDAMALLTRWTDAQNAGDFAAYEQLYASKFLGIKRAGDRTTSFARAPWLADRKRMFSKPMKVEASDTQVRSAAGSAEIVFTQRWASGTYSDMGPKRLLLVREGGTLRIANEEMLHSEKLELAGKKNVDVHFTLALRSGLYMVLPEAKAPKQHGAVTPEATVGSLYTSIAKIDEVLPQEVRSWKGQKVRLDDGCIAEVDGFVLLSRVTPHFGTVQTWRGEGEAKKLDAQQVAEQAFALSEPYVAAHLRGCSQGTFAQREQAPALVTGTSVTDAAVLQQARDAFTKLTSVQAMQKRHLAEAEDPSGTWWASSLKAAAFRHPSSGQTLISVQADNEGGCTDFAAAEWALFELRDGKLTLLRSGLSPAHVLRALDVDGDGRLELLVENPDFSTERALISPDSAWPEPKLTQSYQDCPC